MANPIKSQRGTSSASFVSFSALLHGGILLALATVPAYKMIPKGGDVTVELEQTSAPNPGASAAPAAAPAPAPAPAPAAAQPPAETVKPVVAKQEVSAPAPAPARINKTKKVAVVQPKPVAAEPKPEVTEESTEDADVKRADDEAKSFAESQKEALKPIEEAAAQADTEVVDQTAQSAAAEALTKHEEKQAKIDALPAPVINRPAQTMTQVNEQAREELKAETPIASAPAVDGAAQTATAALAATGSGESSAAPTAGEARSYLELKQLAGNQAPQYPSISRRKGQQGEVVLQYYVTSQGSVKDLKVIQSSGFADLDQEAVRAVGRFRYVPGQEGWTSHPVIFNLKGPTAEQASRLRTAGQVLKEK